MNKTTVVQYQLSPGVQTGFSEGILLLTIGTEVALSIADKAMQHCILDLCLFLRAPKLEAQIIEFLTTEYGLSASEADDLFRDFYARHFLIRANVFHAKEQYSRNLLFYNLNEVDPTIVHNKLQDKHVIVLGCGGIGNSIALHLVNAGIGRLTLVDNDIVETSNLTQQIMFTLQDIESKTKTNALAAALQKRSLRTEINTLDLFVDDDTVVQLPQCDFINIAADSDDVDRVVNRYCYQVGTPFMSAFYLAQTAYFGPLVMPGYSACLDCFKNRYIWQLSTSDAALQKKMDALKQHKVTSSLGPVVAIAAALASLDIIRFLGEFGELQAFNRGICLNTQTLEWTFEAVERAADCRYCGDDAVLNNSASIY